MSVELAHFLSHCSLSRAGRLSFRRHGFRFSSAGPGNYFSVAGRRPGENIFLWNGVEYPGGTIELAV
jgi:hypothetical protein